MSFFLLSIFLLKVGLLVVDEVHMVGEKGGRGANLEALLTKVNFLRGHQLTFSNFTGAQVHKFKTFYLL